MAKAKDLNIGDRFKFSMINPKGYLILQIIDFKGTCPWCRVINHHYDTPGKDEYDEEDRYKRGDELLFPYSNEVELIK